MGSKPCVGFSPFFFLSLREKYLFRKWLSKIIYIKKQKVHNQYQFSFVPLHLD
jgi:hypothetical protein